MKKFTCSVTINRPQKEVAELFADPDKLKEYQDGFQRKELISGERGQVGAVSKLYYLNGKRPMLLTETIVKNDLPHEFEANYHHEHMDNSMKSSFIELSDNETRYDTEIHYTEFRGFLIKVIATLFPGMFKKQVQKWLENFKKYAEDRNKP